MTIVTRLGDRWIHGGAVLANQIHGRWTDFYFAAGVALVLELEAFTSDHRRGPLVLNALAVAMIALATIWRRRAPLLFLAVVGIVAISLSRGLASASTNYATLTGLYCVLLPPYTVAAWEKRNRALFGLTAWVVIATGVVTFGDTSIRDVVPATMTAFAAWVAGRVMYTQRALANELEAKSSRLAAERADRARLAVASERMRIARELHAVVARSVVGMVLQAEAAARLLDVEESPAEVALATIEDNGRDALAEMRRILGVLRRPGDARELEPQPGVGQIYTLVQRARDQGHLIDLRIVGDPGTLPALIDFGVYRILAEALDSARAQPCSGVAVTLSFDGDDIELTIDAQIRNSIKWPTPAISERVALCGGDLRVDGSDNAWHLHARLSSRLRGALA